MNEDEASAAHGASPALRAQEEDQRREYNDDVKRMERARQAYVNKLIAFDEKWCPEVVGKRKRDGFYNIV